MTHHNICDECETVAHCSNHGCIPKHQALDRMAENARELGLDYDPTQIDWEAIAADQAMTIALLKAEQLAQPEPVAFTVAGEVRNWSEDFSKYQTQHYVRPVYTTPPAQRTWVGLTLQDREALRDRFGGWNYPGILVDAIFDMIKEKNT